MSEQLLKYKPHISNFELFSKRILTKNLNPGIFCGGCGGRGGGGGGGGESRWLKGVGRVMSTRAVKVFILVPDTSSRPVCHNCKVL